MKIRVEPLAEKHIEAIKARLDPAQSDVAHAMCTNPNYVSVCRAGGPTCAFIINDVVMAIAGLIDYVGTGRAILWCAIADDATKCFVALFKRMSRTLKFFPRRRIEAIIETDYVQGKRFARLGGFKFEGIKEAFLSTGKDAEEWVLINREAA